MQRQSFSQTDGNLLPSSCPQLEKNKQILNFIFGNTEHTEHNYLTATEVL